MSVRLAPVLHELAGRLAKRPATDARAEPVQWAYALRDAAQLARPDVLVSHWDPMLEADALRSALPTAQSAGGDWVERMLAVPSLSGAGATAATIELVATLSALFPSGPGVAATVTGPASIAAALAPALLGDAPAAEDRVELADLCADLTAALIGAYGSAGASMIMVLEHDETFLPVGERAGVHAPLVRALAHERLDGVLIAPPGAELDAAGYTVRARPWDGTDAPPAVALAPAELWMLAPERFSERFSILLAAGMAADDVLIVSDGPLPAAIPLENLQAHAPM